MSTTSLQQRRERSKIPFHIPLSPEKFTQSWEPWALKHLGPSHFNSIACQNKPQLCHGWHWVCGCSSALDYVCSQTRGCRAQGSWCSALPCNLHFLLFGPSWGHNWSDFLSLVPQFTWTGRAQIWAVTQDTGWKVRDNTAREPFGKRYLRETEAPAVPSAQEELGIPLLLKDFSNNWLKSFAVSSLLFQSYFTSLPGGEKIQFAAYGYHWLFSRRNRLSCVMTKFMTLLQLQQWLSQTMANSKEQ